MVFGCLMFLHLSLDDNGKLEEILKVCQKQIHSSTHLFKLAQDAFRYAFPSNDNGMLSQDISSSAYPHMACCLQHSPTPLFQHQHHRLFSESAQTVTEVNCHQSCGMLKVAFELGLQVLRMTLTSQNWRRQDMVCIFHVPQASYFPSQ